MRRLLIALGLTLAAGIMASGIMAGVIWLVTYGFSHSMLLCRLIFYAPPVIFIFALSWWYAGTWNSVSVESSPRRAPR